MPTPYTEDQLVEKPAIGLFAELGWHQDSGMRRQRTLALIAVVGNDGE